MMAKGESSMEDGSPWIAIIIAVVLITINGILASAEIALVSLNKIRLKQKAESGDKKAQSLLDMKQNPSNFLSTIQIGIGRLSEGVLSCLYHKKRLGVHSGLLPDGVVDLVERGVVDNSCKGLKNGKVVTTTMVGTDRLFKFVHQNRAVESYPSDYTHNQVTLSKINRLHAINTAIQVDLMGQVNAESIGGVQVSGVGGQTDFFCGAALSRGGKSIIVIPSASGNEERSKIVPRLEHGASVTNLRHDVDFVVTEYGIAGLTGMTLRERARALITVAHPKFRDWVEAEGKISNVKGLLPKTHSAH